ncbi:unnamed protein product [Meloidogyne enterolobii]|uniref:Uncharacterized protein n=1 Tax=Meloidogyne enterolobii TaxID=390850 RepID=A0ACB0Z5U8_MELEN
MACSAIFFLDMKGKVLISRNYRGDVDLTIIEKFIPFLVDMEEEGKLTPIVDVADAIFVFIKYNNVYVVAVSDHNVNVGFQVFLHWGFLYGGYLGALIGIDF